MKNYPFVTSFIEFSTLSTPHNTNTTAKLSLSLLCSLGFLASVPKGKFAIEPTVTVYIVSKPLCVILSEAALRRSRRIS